MGALISTIGTRLLCEHFSNVAFKRRIHDLRHDPNMNSPDTTKKIKDYFKDQNYDLLRLTNEMKHAHSGHGAKKCFLPDNSSRSPHLEARWLYFLDVTKEIPGKFNVLTPVNHAKIKKAISDGLEGDYAYISFDCIDATDADGNSINNQLVFRADEYDDTGDLYLKIVLMTPAMDQFIGDQNLQLDPQPRHVVAEELAGLRRPHQQSGK